MSKLLTLFFVLAVGMSSLQGAEPDMRSKVTVGATMPPIDVSVVTGGRFSLAANQGKVVVINFWATWCGPCKVEMPELQAKVWNRYRSRLDFGMVAIAREQTSKEVVPFQQEHPQFSFPLAVDPDRSTYKLFADAGIPRTYVVDRAGRVVYTSSMEGRQNVQEIADAVAKALGK